MRRLHVFEFHDQPWFPKIWRDIATEIMGWFASCFHVFRPVAPILKRAMEKCRADRIVDLCSGASGPVLAMQKEFADRNRFPVTVVLTDKYPNEKKGAEKVGKSGGNVTFVKDAIDARNVPADLSGFRTLFASFHHFRPKEAAAILQDAMENDTGIGIFEYTEKSWIWFLVLPLFPFLFPLFAPFILRPFSWKKTVAVYLPPVLGFTILWDGIVSCFRSYSLRELRQMIEGLPDKGFDWELGRVRSFGACRVTYLIGVPFRHIRNK